ncbi:MAG: magnesium-protoporphyrin IX monomethyl ester anaerobic oxidative cyclase [Verrucomicrobia bacterium]|nr:magnesium-protoporphyrin IX monomethyl ester anaerobic oxidative cyclase [Verrucomicrobiota bacterium]
MRILLVNPPHPSIGSRIPQEHLPPLGLLALGGPLLDAGHQVGLLDAEFGPMTVDQIISEARAQAPDAVLLGHSGSTSGHPIATRIARAVRAALPHAWVIYGGVYPTYHWADIMEQELAIDFIVRGEGEETVVRLVAALEQTQPLEEVRGIVFREGTVPAPGRVAEGRSFGDAPARATPPAPVIGDLDTHRVGWELIDHSRYSYWGNRRAVVVQFSRGCPHHCHYCGQRGFWRTWRHRDPVRFAADLARLHREHGVEVINFADENPSASRTAWQAFLEALIAQKVPLILVGSTRANDIVRDADLLHLYKQAGVARFLLGIESTDENTLQAIRKGSTQAIDREAIRLLRKHGIISMTGWVAGFAQETDRDYWRTLRQIVAYDPDQIQALYATPHRWTPFAQQAANRRVIQTDLSRWDYKHQVLESKHVPNWRVLLWVKVIEAVSQLRPKSLFRLLAHPDPGFRAAMRWYYRIGRRVWPYELRQWLFHDRRTRRGPTLAEFLGIGCQARPPRSPALPSQTEERSRLATRRLLPDAPTSARTPLTAEISQPWTISHGLLSSPRMNQYERATVSGQAEPVSKL